MDEFNREVPPLGANDPELQRPLKIVTKLELRALGTAVATPSSNAGLNQSLPPLNPRSIVPTFSEISLSTVR